MTVILILLCLAIAGRELYLAFDRGRGPAAADLAEAQRAADARIGSLVAQLNEHLVPDVNARLTGHRRALDELTGDVAELRGHLRRRLDQAAAVSLGAAPPDVVAGALVVEPAAARPAVADPYERFAARYGLRVELTDEDRYYLSGRSPRALERDFLDLLRDLRADPALTAPAYEPEPGPPSLPAAAPPVAGAPGPAPAGLEARTLLDALLGAGQAGAQVGPLLAVRTPETLVCGVLPLAELRRPETAALPADPVTAAVRLRRLPEARYCALRSR